MRICGPATSVFTSQLDKALNDMARPPTRRHTGTRLRASKPLSFPLPLLDAELAASHCALLTNGVRLTARLTGPSRTGSSFAHRRRFLGSSPFFVSLTLTLPTLAFHFLPYTALGALTRSRLTVHPIVGMGLAHPHPSLRLMPPLQIAITGSTDLRVAAQDALSVWSRTVRVVARAVARHARARARPEMLAHESGGCHTCLL